MQLSNQHYKIKGLISKPCQHNKIWLRLESHLKLSDKVFLMPEKWTHLSSLCHRHDHPYPPHRILYVKERPICRLQWKQLWIYAPRYRPEWARNELVIHLYALSALPLHTIWILWVWADYVIQHQYTLTAVHPMRKVKEGSYRETALSDSSQQ